MLLVKTYLDKSSINGIGLFAAEFIPKGTEIWKFTDGLDLYLTDISKYTPITIDFLTTYCYMTAGRYILCVDNSRFINHHKNPNTNDKLINATIAERDIYVGEEITSNYGDFGINETDSKFNTDL